MIALIFAFLLTVHAEDTTDATTRDLLIDKLSKVNLNLAPNDHSKQAIVLRLADLYAEKGRQLAMKELEGGCSGVCKAGSKERAQALNYYNEMLPQLTGDGRAKVLVQMGHLEELTGSEPKAIATYETLLKDSDPKIVSEAQLSLAEIYFKRRNWKEAIAFYQKVKVSHPSQKGLAGYRVGWCYFNMDQVKPAVEELREVLNSPEMLSRGQSGTLSIDKQFQEEVARDFATFLSRRPQQSGDLDELYKLSPDNAKLAHLSYLASEYERLGQVNDAITSWRYVIQRQSDPKQRLEGHVHLAQLNAIHQNRAEAIKDFENSLNIWGSLGQCTDDTCKQLRSRLRQFVLDWNTTEKKAPSKELLAAYQKYLTVFPADTDMRLWQAQVAGQVKEYELAVKENLTVATELTEENKKTPLDATKKGWLETSLLEAIENAELAKNAALEDQATKAYLDMSLDRKKEYDVRYQRAHTVYEAAQYAPAADQMRDIALSNKAPMELRTKAADLALDSLVLLKDDTRLESWSRDLAKALPKEGANYMSVARKSVLTQSAAAATSNNLDGAWVTLMRFDPNGASQEEKNNYYKNKLILAEKMHKLPEAREAADQLLRQPGLSTEDQQFALSRKAWLAELEFDFPTALAATEKMTPAKDVDPAGRSLKLAMLAELSQKDPSLHYKKFVQESKDKDKTVAVTAQIVKSSPAPLKDFESYKNVLAQKPEFYTETLFEIYAKTGKQDLLPKMTAQPQFASTPYGKAALREELLASYQTVKEKLEKSKIDSTNQKKLASSLKARVALLDQAEKLAGKAVDQQEWASQILLLNLLASEHKKFFDEVLSLPVPQGLSGEDEQQYLGLLSQQAAPHQTKANDIQAKLKEMYANKDAFTQFASAVNAQMEPMRKIYVQDMNLVKTAVPADLQALLVERAPAGVPEKPNLAEVEKARQTVRDQPFDSAQIQNLIQLEKQMGRATMVAYLQSRLDTLNATQSVSPAAPTKPSVKQ